MMRQGAQRVDTWPRYGQMHCVIKVAQDAKISSGTMSGTKRRRLVWRVARFRVPCRRPRHRPPRRIRHFSLRCPMFSKASDVCSEVEAGIMGPTSTCLRSGPEHEYGEVLIPLEAMSGLHGDIAGERQCETAIQTQESQPPEPLLDYASERSKLLYPLSWRCLPVAQSSSQKQLGGNSGQP